ncbi:MAG TPA: DUF2922 domain-containing protein, partial [Clostridia bacterium]|nr:DUF2922 domain-containing protein [Clostridia bacterium]
IRRMEMTKVLVLDFLDSASKRFSLKIPEPREDLESEEVRVAMADLIDKDPFVRTLVSIERAYIVTTTEEMLVFGA